MIQLPQPFLQRSQVELALVAHIQCRPQLIDARVILTVARPGFCVHLRESISWVLSWLGGQLRRERRVGRSAEGELMKEYQ